MRINGFACAAGDKQIYSEVLGFWHWVLEVWLVFREVHSSWMLTNVFLHCLRRTSHTTNEVQKELGEIHCGIC